MNPSPKQQLQGNSNRRRRPEQLIKERGGLIELLHVPAILFGAISKLRGKLYDKGVLPSHRCEVPVICVGNISAGGTGKTPMVVWLAKRLQMSGKRPGILSRGYGKAGVSGASSDEARLYEELLGDLPRVAMADRIQGVQLLMEQGAGVVVMDDGFQHRRLARDLDLVLIDATRPWGLPVPVEGKNNTPVQAFLPRGLLRESGAALGRANAIVITRTDQVADTILTALEAELECLAPDVPRLLSQATPCGLRGLFGKGDAAPLSSLKGQEIDAVSAIGNPENFQSSLEGLGALVGEHRAFADHYEYQEGDLKGLGGVEGAPRRILTTAKDAVKIFRLGPQALGCDESEVWVLDIEFELSRGEDVLTALLQGLPVGKINLQLDSLHEGLHG
jgi:tetraacyldisaccharide 4'-kinase